MNWKKKCRILGGLFDVLKKQSRISSIEEEMNKPNFWDNIDEANKLNKELTTIISKTPSLNILFFPSLLIGISPFLILLFILKALKVLSIASFRFLRKV